MTHAITKPYTKYGSLIQYLKNNFSLSTNSITTQKY